jgi:hypothetical protein
LIGLPELSNAILNHILKDGNPYKLCARIKHDNNLKQTLTKIDKHNGEQQQQKTSFI